MFDRPIAAFDIETIPDPDLGRRLLGIEGSDADVVHEMVRRRLEETKGSSEYPQLPWHRVVSACVAELEPRSSRVSIRALGNEPLDERGHLTGFYDLATRQPRARLVSWNGGGFDLPVLRYRSLVHGVAAPAFYREDDAHHVDLMVELSGHGASARVGLGTLAGVVGLPGKTFLDRPIYDHVLDGEGPRVVEYCKLDAVQTLLLFLVWSFHCGRLSREDLKRHVDGVRAAIAALPYAAWRDVETTLAAWPPWPQP